MKQIEVVQATESDLSWVLRLFAENTKILGNPFWLKQAYRESGHHLVVVREKGFAHYRVGKDGMRTLKEIAVGKDYKKQGIGKAMIDAVGRPITFKTDADNAESNLFYEACGFVRVGRARARSGKIMNVYQGW